ncbi:hypothetical protein D3C73_660160 [compost metagenome]
MQQGREAECLLDSRVQPFILFTFELGIDQRLAALDRVKWHLAIQAGDRFAIFIDQLQQLFATRWCSVQRHG